jgi:mannose-6-phosphate isomerase
MKKQIIHVEPVYKERIWGGTLIKTRFNGLTEIDRIGELWCVCAMKDNGDNILTELKMSLSDAYDKLPELFNVKSERFPIRCTLMDPIDNLSVQVHPHEAYAMKHLNSYGKHEAWAILETGSNHQIQFGHKATTKEEFKALASANRWGELLNYEQVKAGDFLDVPSGTVHAIGKQMLTFEIARNSDITYRIYDYGRVDVKTGQPRDLHIESALDVINFPHQEKGPIHPEPVLSEGCKITTYIDTPGKYTLKKIETETQGRFELDGFYFITVVDGEGKVDEISIRQGETLLVPDRFGKITVSGKLTALISSYRD